MWNITVMLVLFSVAGYYTTHNLEQQDQNQANGALAVADDMAVYRGAVIDYFSSNDLRDTTVSLATLKAAHALPAWSTSGQGGVAPAWGNYRDGAGLIYIYATRLPAGDISADIARLSRNSMLAGVYRREQPNLQSPVFGDTHIPLTALAGLAVPDGAPVWIGTSP
jgi:hypothetical protein